ncbi:DoxX family protein [Variovorax robiniae]|uniref:DoxX family protein n=1 Tax=Variovorax robiniae TaxID=1836199 RepID=A0ABU8X6K5_9BURK
MPSRAALQRRNRAELMGCAKVRQVRLASTQSASAHSQSFFGMHEVAPQNRSHRSRNLWVSGLLAFAYFIGHATKGFVLTPFLNQGEAALLFSFVFLYIAAAGAGPWSVDALRSKSAEPTGIPEAA